MIVRSTQKIFPWQPLFVLVLLKLPDLLVLLIQHHLMGLLLGDELRTKLFDIGPGRCRSHLHGHSNHLVLELDNLLDMLVRLIDYKSPLVICWILWAHSQVARSSDVGGTADGGSWDRSRHISANFANSRCCYLSLSSTLFQAFRFVLWDLRFPVVLTCCQTWPATQLLSLFHVLGMIHSSRHALCDHFLASADLPHSPSAYNADLLSLRSLHWTYFHAELARDVASMLQSQS